MKLRAIIVMCFVCMAFSCGPKPPDEETLLLYARASSVYRNGGYSEAALMLKEEKSFPQALLLRGKAQFFAGEDDAAETSLRQALRLRPNSIEAGLYLARLEREKGNVINARQFVERILSDDPYNIRALRLAAELSRDIGPEGEAEAAAYLDQAVEALGESALIFLDRARSRWIGGNRKLALEDISKAKALLSEDNPLFRSIVNLELIISGREAFQ